MRAVALALLLAALPGCHLADLFRPLPALKEGCVETRTFTVTWWDTTGAPHYAYSRCCARTGLIPADTTTWPDGTLPPCPTP